MEQFNIGKRTLELDDLRHQTEDGVEFWYARELMGLFGYVRWENFEVAINRAIDSVNTSKTAAREHFREVTKSFAMPKGGTRAVNDYMLTRYACYLIAMNGDPRKQEIAFAQSYLALQTRSHELIAQRMGELQRLQSLEALSETEKLFSAIAFERDVDARGVARIKSFGDEALFGGNNTEAMKRRLGVPKSKPLADALPDVTLAAKNLAMSMTNFNVEEHDLNGEKEIGTEHVANNRSVRETLTNRGIYPEALPPEEDAKKVVRRVRSDERKLEDKTQGFADID